MRQFLILMAVFLISSLAACNDKPPLPFGVTPHACPKGAHLETQDNYGQFAGVDGSGTKDAVEAVCVTKDRYLRGLTVVYDTANGKKLHERMWSADGKIVEEHYWSHNSLTRAFRKGACGGMKVRWPAGHWATFHMPCKKGKKASEQFCFARPEDVRLPTPAI